MPAAARKTATHPNSLRALEENRTRTQFNGPDAPPRCAKETCNRFAWGKSPSGLCWFHAGGVKARNEPRPTVYGQYKRGLNRARRMAAQSLDHDPPTPEELRFAAAIVPALIDKHDRPRLEMMVRDLHRGRIEHRAYRQFLEAFLVRS